LIYVYGKLPNEMVKFDDGLDIVVFSPTFCWYEVLDLPLKRKSKITNMAKHIMSDRPSSYQDFEVRKVGKQYEVFSFDKSNIKDIVINLGKTHSDVYFIYEFQIDQTVMIDENLSLIPYENKVIEYSGRYDEEKKTLSQYLHTLNLEKIKPIVKLDLDNDSSIKKMFVINTVLFLSITISLISQYLTITQIENSIEKIDKKSKTNYEIRSFIKQYSAKEEKSSKMIQQLYNALTDNSSIKEIVYKNNQFQIVKK